MTKRALEAQLAWNSIDPSLPGPVIAFSAVAPRSAAAAAAKTAPADDDLAHGGILARLRRSWRWGDGTEPSEAPIS